MGQVSEKVQAVLDAYCVANGWPVCRTDDDFQETLDQPPVFTETRATRRWWTEAFTVVDLGGTLVGYMNATTTGDDSAGDKGWEFDPATICLVERHDEVKTVTTYRPIVTGEDAGLLTAALEAEDMAAARAILDRHWTTYHEQGVDRG